jgi:hypothetical protein
MLLTLVASDRQAEAFEVSEGCDDGGDAIRH